MATYSKTIVVGRLGRDVDMRFSSAGKPWATTSVAVDSQGKNGGTTWFSVTMFGRTAEVAGEYLSKGDTALFEGEVSLNEWTGNDGEKRCNLKLIAHSIKMIITKGKEKPATPTAPPPPPPGDFDDDVPF